jgi:hypothetical protein
MKKNKFNFTIMYIGQKIYFDRYRTTEPETRDRRLIHYIMSAAD